MITREQSLDKQARAHPFMKPAITEEMTVVVPGRRALGEDWVQVTIGHDDDEIVVHSEATVAPADRRPMLAVAGADAEYTAYILEAMREKAEKRSVTPQDLTPQERYEAVNRAWMDFCEEKLAFLKGRSSFGAGGGIQRQRVVQNPTTRPVHRKD